MADPKRQARCQNRLREESGGHVESSSQRLPAGFGEDEEFVFPQHDAPEQLGEARKREEGHRVDLSKKSQVILTERFPVASRQASGHFARHSCKPTDEAARQTCLSVSVVLVRLPT